MDLTSTRATASPSRAALFDLDGTLVDTLADLAASVNHALSARGLPALPEDSYRLLVGTGARNLARLAAEQALLRTGRPPAAAVEEAVRLASPVFRDFQDEYARRWDRATRAYPGVPEALAALAAAGVPLGVLSNKPDRFAKQVVERYFPGIPFAAVHGEREGVPRKPDPAAALDALAAFGLPASDVAYLGDSGSDMAFAVSCGFRAIGVLWGFRDRGELLAGGAQDLLERPDGIPARFAGKGGEAP